MPDGGMFFNEISKEKVDVHISSNNIKHAMYQRRNNVSSYWKRVFDEKHLKWVKSHFTLSTEGLISLMNYITNLHLNHYKDSENKKGFKINTFVSSMTGINMDSQLDSLLLQVLNLLFPVALSMGFPILLYTLVLEKEESIKDLLTINGMSNSIYWINYIVYYSIVLNSVSIFFVLFGWIMITNMSFFVHTSIFVQIIMLFIWNFAQICLGLFLSIFISSSRLASLFGY